jgi:hypothetical protein
MLRLTLWTMLCCSALPAPGSAADDPDSGEREFAANEQPLDLGIIEISADRWTYEQEITLRMIREAYGQPRSALAEDRDKWVCWIQDQSLSKFAYLYCARNGDIQSRRPSQRLKGGKWIAEGGYGRFLVSTHPVIEHKFEKDLASFRGGDDFNSEFLALVMAGERPPRKIPNETEMEQFAAAWQELEAMEPGDSKDAQRSEIILNQGLTVNRYNQIQTIVDTYKSIRAQLMTIVNGNEGKPASPAPG